MLTAWQRSTSNGRLAELLLKVARRYQASRLHQCGWGKDQLGGVALTQGEASTMLKRVESLTLTDIAQALEELVQEQKQFDVGDKVVVQDLVDPSSTCRPPRCDSSPCDPFPMWPLSMYLPTRARWTPPTHRIQC